MKNSFTVTDYLDAKESFIRWQGKVNESVDEYLLRQRKAELNELVKEVIKNELSDHQKTIVNLRWYQNLTPSEIAQRLGLDRSTVSRQLDKINTIIYEKLKYAIEYRYGKSYSNKAKLIIKNGDAYTCTVKSSEISARVKGLRTEQCLSLSEVSELTGITSPRLCEIEKSGNKMTMPELKKLSVFYRCTSDYILFGN